MFSLGKQWGTTRTNVINQINILVYSICDFDTFVQVISGQFEQFKKLGLLSFEFEELAFLMEYYVKYLKSKHV